MKRLNWLIIFLVFSMIFTGLLPPAPAEASTLMLTFPTGGETLFKGETYIITWDTYWYTQDRVHNIYLYTDGGRTFVCHIGDGWHGNYTWTIGDEIPTTTTARIMIQVIEYPTSPPVMARDLNNYDFTITTKPALLPPSLMTVPPAPLNLTAAAGSSSSITLNWVDKASNEAGFRIERKRGDKPWTQIAQVGANVTSYVDTGLAAATTYYYRVRAYNTIGSSPYSKEASATTPISLLPPGSMLTFPAAPTNLVAAETSSTALNLSWVDHAGNEAGFRIERRELGELWAQITEVGANATSYLDMGLSPDTVYDYRVRAYNIIGNSAYSNEASARTMPAPPPAPVGQTVIRLTIGSTRYYVDGSQRNMDVAPIIREGRTLLPIRYVADSLGAVVRWDPGEQKVTIMLNTRQGLGASEPEEEEEPVQPRMVELWIGQNRARVNGAYQYIDPANHNVVPIVVPPGRTMLPLRFIAETLGCQVDWNGVTQEVTVIYPAP